MTIHDYHALAELPQYKELMARRRKLVWPLALIVIFSYFLFILLIAFDPAALGQPVGDSIISVGILAGLGLIFLTFAITGIYVHCANRQLEQLIQAVRQQAGE
jgi:uncharacterized membrane protein (DUF485 family)